MNFLGMRDGLVAARRRASNGSSPVGRALQQHDDDQAEHQRLEIAGAPGQRGIQSLN